LRVRAHHWLRHRVPHVKEVLVQLKGACRRKPLSRALSQPVSLYEFETLSVFRFTVSFFLYHDYYHTLMFRTICYFHQVRRLQRRSDLRQGGRYDLLSREQHPRGLPPQHQLDHVDDERRRRLSTGYSPNHASSCFRRRRVKESELSSAQ
jgi:hypothetical protein